MRNQNCIALVVMAMLSMIVTSSHAGSPLWTFTPLTATTVSLAVNQNTIVRYRVTNKSARPHTLAMLNINGVRQLIEEPPTVLGSTTCATPFTLAGYSDCDLILEVIGSQVKSGNTNGPSVCENGNPLQCYRPNAEDTLNINILGSQYSVGGTVSGLTGNVVLQNNGYDTKTVTANGSFIFTTTLPEGSPYNVTVKSQPSGQVCNVINGTGTMPAANVTNVDVTCSTNATTLTTSVSTLALSVTGLTEYGVNGTPSSGVARTITVTNTGSNTAVNLAVNPPTWPSGTISSTTCGSTLASGANCTITVTPGNTATSDGTNPCSSGTTPVPGVIQVTADNASTVSTNVDILSYGCIYESGYVFAFDDTTATTTSVGGKVVTTTDQAAPFPSGIIWSSDGSGGSSGDVAYDSIYGISETSTTSSPNPSSGQVTGQTACNGVTNGACDMNNIYVYYQNFATGHPINLNYYAAGLCKQTISGMSDWYLPSLCEMGYGLTACGSSSTPTLQNLQSSLVDYNSINLLSGIYWSSTEGSGSPLNDAWYQSFSLSSSNQSLSIKNYLLGVRCVRVMT